MFFLFATLYFVTCHRTCLCFDDLVSPRLTKILNISNFTEIRQSPFFVDKTVLIYKVLRNDEPLLFTAPPGFGKSTNLDMIRVFLSNSIDHKVSRELFVDTNIAKDSNFVKTHLGNHPVMHCSFKSTSPITDYNSMVSNFRTSLHKTFLQHDYLADSKLLDKVDLDRFKKYLDADNNTSLEPSEISSGLHFLLKTLKTHHSKPVYLLIDDYDSVIWDSLMTQSLALREVLGFYDAVLNQVLSDKDNIKKSILTGTSSIFVKLLPGLGNTKCVKFLHDKDYETFFGLTGDDVDYLVDKTVYVSLRPNMTDWYDGYTSPDLSAHIYNTNSFFNFLLLSEGELKSYWTNHKVEKALRILLEDWVRTDLLLESPENLIFVVRELKEFSEGVLEVLKTMITQEIWNADVSDLLIHLLTEQGYFTFDKAWEKSGYDSPVTFKLANFDVCEYLKKFILGYKQELKKRKSNINIV